jgi:CBS domain-containing protein
MKVKDMMHKGVEYVAPNAKLQAIAKKMRDRDIGAMLVCEDGKTLGMITDRDIALRALANGKDISTTEARDVMSRSVVFCRDNEEAEDALRIMENKKIRRLPVLTEDAKLVGMVSLGDISHALSRE